MFAGVLKRYIDGYSEAYFYGPKVKQSINALPSCIDYAHLAKYDRTVYVGLMLQNFLETPDMTRYASISAIVERLSGATVIVVGDTMLDRFVDGVVDRISPEAPIPVFLVRRETSMLGASGNVLRNLVALGGAAHLITALGDDDAGDEIRALIAEEVQTDAGLYGVPGRRTSIKTRYVASGQQMMRADRETVEEIPLDFQDRIVAQVEMELPNVGALLLSDYGKGVLSDALLRRLIDRARAVDCPVVVDPKGNNYRRYVGARVVTPNRQELALATNMPTADDASIEAACKHLISTTGVDAVLATRSEQGMTLVDGNDVHHFSARAREVFDVSGAGDTVAAAVAAALSIETTLSDAAQLANIAASVVVGKVGTAVVRPAEILSTALEGEWSNAEAKVSPASVAEERVLAWRRQGRRIGFTNGCFDLLHPGHVSLIAQARRKCDRLIVALNSDASVRRLKGEGRPVQNEASRATVLASLADVDAVVVFSEDTPLELIQSLKPDVLIKGADYLVDGVVGAEDVKSWGGEVVLANLLDGHSTTATIQRLES
jgi:D-beta-D-heptose 7-phosphate kinase/D-beta-D-heptose 1-phosphate adenosyltransferase